MSLEARRTGEALRAAAGELLRVWRSARHAVGGMFPGALDGVMEEFLERVAEALLLDTPPEEVWPRTGGVARLPPGPDGAALAEADWRLAAGVLQAAGQALQISPEVAARLQRAVDAAIEALPVDGPRRPPRVLVVRLLSGAPRSR